MDYQISTRCFVKMIMHSLKYPCYTVNGLILGEKKKPKDSYYFLDCIPLFHLAHGLTPSMETALHIVSNYCKENNLSIIAYYQANKDYYDSTPDAFAIKISEKLWELNNDTVLVMINSFGANFSKDSNKSSDLNDALHIYNYVEGRWKQKATGNIEKPDKTLELVKNLVYRKQQHMNLIDFDNHLDDISRDWRNKTINNLIENEN